MCPKLSNWYKDLSKKEQYRVDQKFAKFILCGKLEAFFPKGANCMGCQILQKIHCKNYILKAKMPTTAATARKNAKIWGSAGLLRAARGSSSMVISLGQGLVQGC